MTLDVSQHVIGAIEEVEKKYSEFDETFMGEPEHGAILSRGRETLNQCYKFGFEVSELHPLGFYFLIKTVFK